MGFGIGVASDMGSTQGMQRKQVPGRAHGARRTVLKHGRVGETWADARSVYPRAEEVLRTAAPVEHVVEHDACMELQRRQGGRGNGVESMPGAGTSQRCEFPLRRSLRRIPGRASRR